MSSALQPHQQRVVVEKTELDDKLVKLRDFFNSPLFQGVNVAERDRMQRQAVAMASYSAILGERITAFGVPA